MKDIHHSFIHLTPPAPFAWPALAICWACGGVDGPATPGAGLRPRIEDGLAGGKPSAKGLPWCPTLRAGEAASPGCQMHNRLRAATLPAFLPERACIAGFQPGHRAGFSFWAGLCKTISTPLQNLHLPLQILHPESCKEPCQRTSAAPGSKKLQPSAQSRHLFTALWHNVRKAKAPVLVTPKVQRLQAPTEKRGFVTS